MGGLLLHAGQRPEEVAWPLRRELAAAFPQVILLWRPRFPRPSIIFHLFRSYCLISGSIRIPQAELVPGGPLDAGRVGALAQVEAAVKEALRLVPPAAIGFRKVSFRIPLVNHLCELAVKEALRLLPPAAIGFRKVPRVVSARFLRGPQRASMRPLICSNSRLKRRKEGRGEGMERPK